jgi:hypothetical protein
MPSPYTSRRLTNDIAGFEENDLIVWFAVNAASVHGFSATHVALDNPVPVGRSAKVTDFQIGVGLPAVSAANFAAGDNGVTAEPRVNSNAVLSTAPVIAIAGSAGQAARTTTWGVGTVALNTSGIVNAASNTLNGGDELTVTYNAKSAGSGAATAAGKGLYGYLRVRLYSA